MTAIFNQRFTQPRRDFLKAGAGLTLGVILAPNVFAQAAGPGRAGGEAVRAAALEPNAFVRIGADDKRYNNLLWGDAQGTGGSTAVANSYEQLRKAGAAARAMLVSAAAQRWNVPGGSVTVSKGVVLHKASGRKATFGELAESASKLPVPEDAKLKDAKDFVYIGKRVPRTDSRAKTNGTAQYTQDVKLPGMLTAVVLHAPRFGAKVKSFDSTKARATPRVVDVVRIPSGVAVLAQDFWSAKQGRDALTVEWDETDAFRLSSA